MNVKRYLTLVKEDYALIFLERFYASVRRDSFCLRMDSHVKVCFLPDIYYGSICTAFFWSSICDGFSFVDIDECGDSSSLCSNGVCENYLGGYQCRCLDGYGPNPQHTSCLGRHNTATCVKFMMRYYYLLHSCIYSSWKGCTSWYCHCNIALIFVIVLNYLEGCISDIDECAMGNGGCETLCFNKPGSFSCGCEPGHLLMPDQRSCQGNLRVGYLNCVNVI